MSTDGREVLYHTDGGDIRGSDIEQALRIAGLSRGDRIMVHSDVAAFGKLGNILDRERFLDAIFAAFIRVISDEGTLIVPTYTYSFCRKEVFDVNNSRSKVGLFSEYIRRRADSVRSENPIFSHAGIGPDARRLLGGAEDDCFGEGSFFGRFYQADGKIINFGKFFAITFIHYIEQKFGVNYRYMKKFSGEAIGVDGTARARNVNYYVRALAEDGMDVQYEMSRMGNELERQNLLRRVPLGSSFILCSKARDCFDVGCQMLRKNMYAFLKHPPNLIQSNA